MFLTRHAVKSSWVGAILIIAMGSMVYSVTEVTARAADDSDKSKLNTLTDDEKAAGWKLLFDGKTGEGWRKYKGEALPEAWTVMDGVLVFQPGRGQRGGDIVTVDQFDNFELSIDWKISKRGNSGIMYRVTEGPDAPWFTGPEYQICDNKGHNDGKHALTSAASCYALYPPTRDVTKPAGEWNSARIVMNGNHVEHWLNGEKVVEYEIGSEDWETRYKKSKFNSMPRFGKEPKGHICLQDHGGRAEFRNIKIRPVGEK